MSITKDYLERLDTEVGIAPAGSQEELDCAHSLAEEFSAHGLKTELQDFSAPSLGYVPYGAALVLFTFAAPPLGIFRSCGARRKKIASVGNRPKRFLNVSARK